MFHKNGSSPYLVATLADCFSDRRYWLRGKETQNPITFC